MNSLTRDAASIWRAGVAAVDSRRLVRDVVRAVEGRLVIGSDQFPLRGGTRIFVVGAGKAGAGMAAGIEQSLASIAQPWRESGDDLGGRTPLGGWVNVPADCVQELPHIRLHPARPPGRNEPTIEGADGAAEILRAVGTLTASDICLCLLSGGGSALLPAPVEGVALSDKQALTAGVERSGRQHPAAQHRSQATESGERRRPGCLLPRGNALHIDHFRCDWRSSGCHRVGAHGFGLFHGGRGVECA